MTLLTKSYISIWSGQLGHGGLPFFFWSMKECLTDIRIVRYPRVLQNHSFCHLMIPTPPHTYVHNVHDVRSPQHVAKLYIILSYILVSIF